MMPVVMSVGTRGVSARRGLLALLVMSMLTLSPLLSGCGGGGSSSTNNSGAVAAPPSVVAANPSPTVAPSPTPTPPQAPFLPSKSDTIQLSHDNTRLFVLNRVTSVGGNKDANKSVPLIGSVSVIKVRNADGSDASSKLAEIAVGRDPFSVSVNGDGTFAYVANAADNTVSVVDIVNKKVAATISVGSEPRGTALNPSGSKLYVTNFSDGTLSVIDTSKKVVTNTINLAFNGTQIVNPFAVAVSNNNGGKDANQVIYVADFFARPVPGLSLDQIEGFDNGKEAHIISVSADSEAPSFMSVLSPMQSGFTADRTAFDTANGAANNTFKSTSADPTRTPQMVFFNQLYDMTINPTTGKVYVNCIGAQPEPPLKFNVNIQALVGVLNANGGAIAAEAVNLNNLIKIENGGAGLNPPFNGTLTRAFMADTVDMAVANGTMLFLSRAGSCVLKGSVDANGAISLGNSATVPATRINSGNIPNGIVITPDGSRAYVNNDVDATVTAINVAGNQPIGSAIASSDLPPVGSQAHQALIGKLAFFTGLGLPPNGLKNANVRSIDTHQFRGMASNDNWSACASCHAFGLDDHVTWIFETGPRHTIPLNWTFSQDGSIQRVLNYNAVRSSVTDFNNNSIGIQGGSGFTPLAPTTPNATPPDSTLVYNHGPGTGVSDALDLMTLWVKVSVRSLNHPTAASGAAVTAGRQVFAAQNCAACHGGPLWTSSKVTYTLPAFTPKAPANGGTTTQNIVNLIVAGAPTDVLLTANGLPIIQRFSGTSPTLDLTNPIEIRGGGAAIGKASVGAAGSFNPPSLLGIASLAPYGHHGRAQNLSQVFTPIAGGGLGHPAFTMTATDISNVVQFILSIDDNTTTF